MTTPEIVTEPGTCPACGAALTPYLYDYRDGDTDELTGGVGYHCPSCTAPKYRTDWTEQVRRRRIDLRISLRDAGRALGMSSGELSSIETGSVEPTVEQELAIDAYLEAQRGARAGGV